MRESVWKGDFRHSAQKREVLSALSKKFFTLRSGAYRDEREAVKLAGSVFVFVPKCAFSLGGNIVQLFGGAIFALHNYLLIGQLRLKSPK